MRHVHPQRRILPTSGFKALFFLLPKCARISTFGFDDWPAWPGTPHALVVEPYVPDWVPRAAELRASIVQAPAPQRDYHPPNAAPAARRSLAVLAPFICLLVVAVVVLNVVLATRSEA